MEPWVNSLTAPLRNTRATAVFCKSLYVCLALKILLGWRVLTEVVAVHSLGHPQKIVTKVLYGPGEWGSDHITIFLLLMLALIAVALWWKPNYVTASLIAWFGLNLYRMSFPITNGADQVTAILLWLAVPLSASPLSRHPKTQLIQRTVYHLSRILGMMYVASIYLISGLDKLQSEAWRSGEAIGMVRGLEYMVNPSLRDWIPQSAAGMWILAWLTIAFELLFPVLVWFRVTRRWILLAGVIFHLIIGTFLGLPDFAAIMIVSYTVFFRSER